MPKILIGGAGGAPSEGVIHSLQLNPKNHVIGMGSEPTDLVMSKADKKLYVPYSNDVRYKDRLLSILKEERPELLHFQNDLEIFKASSLRDCILETGTKLFMPDHEVIDTCVHKFKSYLAFKAAGIVVPKNLEINTEEDLRHAFEELSDSSGRIWLRESGIGGGGKGSLPTNNFAFAKAWIDHYDGWGEFLAAEMLTSDTVTWMSIWHEGSLILAQTRAREGWTHGNRAISGVTGVTKVGVTLSDQKVTETAINSIMAVSKNPHGIFGVDMAYDKNGIPNPTEINISRFFTTVRFFTEAGINFPETFKAIALGERLSVEPGTINPLADDLMWLRAMDRSPMLLSRASVDEEIHFQ